VNDEGKVCPHRNGSFLWGRGLITQIRQGKKRLYLQPKKRKELFFKKKNSNRGGREGRLKSEDGGWKERFHC